MHQLITLGVPPVKHGKPKVLKLQEIAVLRSSGDIYLHHFIAKERRHDDGVSGI